mmetsp:Transcript_27559/g.75888  ORF Transcript_27559/g.75888 Transcript_27559/m.75888 type:complete len:236 (-) Transcript_27559:12-719(-)
MMNPRPSTRPFVIIQVCMAAVLFLAAWGQVSGDEAATTTTTSSSRLESMHLAPRRELSTQEDVAGDPDIFDDGDDDDDDIVCHDDECDDQDTDLTGQNTAETDQETIEDENDHDDKEDDDDTLFHFDDDEKKGHRYSTGPTTVAAYRKVVQNIHQPKSTPTMTRKTTKASPALTRRPSHKVPLTARRIEEQQQEDQQQAKDDILPSPAQLLTRQPSASSLQLITPPCVRRGRTRK